MPARIWHNKFPHDQVDNDDQCGHSHGICLDNVEDLESSADGTLWSVDAKAIIKHHVARDDINQKENIIPKRQNAGSRPIEEHVELDDVTQNQRDRRDQGIDQNQQSVENLLIVLYQIQPAASLYSLALHMKFGHGYLSSSL